MKKLVLMLCAMLAIVLIGCSRYNEEVTTDYALPPELSDCSIYDMSDGYRRITVVRCPNSSVTTSHMSGKVHVSNTVIDGSGSKFSAKW